MKVKPIADAALAMLAGYDWPGNVRELRNVIERLVILSEESIDVGDLPEEIVAEVARRQREASAAASELPRVELPAEARALPLREFRDHMEREYIRIKLDENGWNISRTATLLGIERTNLHKKMRALGLSRDSQGHGAGARLRRRREPRRCSRWRGRSGSRRCCSARSARTACATGWRRRCSRSTAPACSTTWCTRWPCWPSRSAPIGCGGRGWSPACSRRGSSIFSGTLYLLAITGMTWLGAVTPLGGLLLIAGWADRASLEGFRPPRRLRLPEHGPQRRRRADQHAGQQADAGQQLAVIVVAARLLDRRELGGAVADRLASGDRCSDSWTAASRAAGGPRRPRGRAARSDRRSRARRRRDRAAGPRCSPPWPTPPGGAPRRPDRASPSRRRGRVAQRAALSRRSASCAVEASRSSPPARAARWRGRPRRGRAAPRARRRASCAPRVALDARALVLDARQARARGPAIAPSRRAGSARTRGSRCRPRSTRPPPPSAGCRGAPPPSAAATPRWRCRRPPPRAARAPARSPPAGRSARRAGRLRAARSARAR